MSNSSWPHALQPTRLLCPRNSPGKNPGVGCHFLLQGVFRTQGSNQRLSRLLYWQVGSLTLAHFYVLDTLIVVMPQVMVINSRSDTEQRSESWAPPGGLFCAPALDIGAVSWTNQSLWCFPKSEKGRGFLAHLSHSQSQRIFRKTWPSPKFQLETYFPLSFLNFEVQFTQTCMTLHKKQCLPGLPKAQAQEAPLHKERPLWGPTSLDNQADLDGTGWLFFLTQKACGLIASSVRITWWMYQLAFSV